MNVKSKGRGTAAVFGFLLLFAGIVGAGVLFVLSQQRPDQAVDDFARAPIGCTTTLEFSETGTFYVFEEAGAEVVPPEGGCVPVADPLSDFRFELTSDDGEIVPRRDDSVGYEAGERTGRSVARFEIEQTGTYEIGVRGSDLAVVAAIGRHPDDGVDSLQRGAVAVGVAGLVLGLLLLLLAGRRSRRAATTSSPQTDGARPGDAPAWPPAPPQVPVNQLQPSEPAVAHEPAPLPSRRPASTEPAPWAAPNADDAAGDPPPDPPTASSPPLSEPELPESPDRPGG